MTPNRSRVFPATIAVACLGLLACTGPGDSGQASSTSGGPFQDLDASVEWTQWGGPNGNFKLKIEGLTDEWGERGPIQLWSRSLGGGYSPIVASRGALFTMYRNGFEDVVIAMRADDGETIWERSYSAQARKKNETQFGEGPNASPLIVGNHLITLGYNGVLNAFELETGKLLWTHDLIDEFGGEILDFGYAASPVPFDNQVIILVGGDVQAVIAFDAARGSIAWSSEPGRVSYATPVIIDVEGQKQIVYTTPAEIVGLDALTGETLWRHPCRNRYEINASSPIWGEDNLLWVPSQLDGGSRVLRLTREVDSTRVEQLWFNEEIGIHFWNSIRLGDHIYASIGRKAPILAGVNIHTGEIAWTQPDFEMANLIDTGGRTLLLDGMGVLALVALSPEGVEVRSQTRILDEVTWTVPTLVGTRLYLRTKKSIRAFDLSRESYIAKPRKESRAQ